MPVYTHNLSLNAAHDWLNFLFLFQRKMNEIVMQAMPYPGSTDPKVSLIKPINSTDAYNRYILSLAASPVFGVWHPNWRVTVIFQNYKTLSKDMTMITLNKPIYGISWDNDFVLPHDWRINAYVDFTGKGDSGSSRLTRPQWNTSVGIQKDIKTQKLGTFTFDLRCDDPFNIRKSCTLTYGIRETEYISTPMREFSLNVTWRFNEAGNKYKGKGSGKGQIDRMGNSIPQ